MYRTDREWERWGASSPYYGVLSVERFRQPQLTPEAEEGFFASGDAHVTSILSVIEKNFGSFEIARALDFGCGVGRVSIPLAKIAVEVVGMDISRSMLAIAAEHSEAHGLHNIKFVESDDELTAATGKFEFVHSYIVLQHIHPTRGSRIIGNLAELVSIGGYLAIQFYTKCNATTLERNLTKARYLFPPANWCRNILKTRPVFEQAMQLHTYDLGRILRTLRKSGFPEVTLLLDSEAHGTFESAFLLARRTGEAPSVLNRHSQ